MRLARSLPDYDAASFLGKRKGHGDREERIGKGITKTETMDTRRPSINKAQCGCMYNGVMIYIFFQAHFDRMIQLFWLSAFFDDCCYFLC